MSTTRTTAQTTAAPADARQAGRRRALLNGMIVSSDGNQSLGCTVRDISESGARVSLPRGAIMPRRFYLLTSRQPTAFSASLVWRNATQAGLTFAGEQTLSPHMDAESRFLWRLYLELGPRATNPFEF